MTLIPLKEYQGIVNLNNCLSENEINELIRHSLSVASEPGTTNNQAYNLNPDDPDMSSRHCTIKWIFPDERINWLFLKLNRLIKDANENFFHLDLNSAEPLQYTIYEAPGDTYGQHTDLHPYELNHRKLSFTIQLSDPSEYEGGEVLIYPTSFKKPVKANINKGSITFFYSHYIHEVTPVTKGTREALVGWFSGPPLK